MSDDREKILSRVRNALAPLAQRTPLPEYDADIAVMRKAIAGRDLVELFSERISAVGGMALTDPAALAAWLRKEKRLRGYCDPALWPELAKSFGPDFTVKTVFDRRRIDDYDFGLTRASGAVAETGTLILKDRDSSSRLAALAPWVHIALVRRSAMFADVSQAIAALGDDPNIIWCTGSSSTVDVESILVRGVHGPGVQIALIVGSDP
jgi:L-lactate dehydrogenase complex protein LldG